MINIGNAGVVNIYVGESAVTAVYVGNTQVWSAVQPRDYSKEYFTLEMLSAGTVSWNVSNVDYSVDDGATWDTWNSSYSANAGDKILLKSSANTNYKYLTIGSTGEFDVYGNSMSLIYGDNFSGQTTLSGTYTFARMFKGNNKIQNAENLVLPATSLPQRACEEMFAASSVKTAPKLPATTIGDRSYNCMFQNATSLVEAPELPATTIGPYGYFYTFQGCTSLTKAPAELPFTTANDRCCFGMFQRTAITKAPALPATTLNTSCYDNMFDGCTGLTQAPALPASALTTGCYALMFGGCTSLTEAPELNAPSLGQRSYANMFSGCTSLNYIKCLATNISATNCTQNWTSGIAAAGTFVKDASMTGWTTGVNGIPQDWNVQDA